MADKANTSQNLSDCSLDLTLSDSLTKSGKKRKKLKRVHSSKRKLFGMQRNNHNISLSSTIVKQSLRNNNRALARALEQKKAEMYGAQRDILQLQEERQQVVERLARLEKVAGAKDAEIDEEVQSRIQSRMENISSVLNHACTNLVTAVDLIQDAIGLCEPSSYSRPPSRPASNGPSAAEPSPKQTRTIGYYSAETESNEPLRVRSAFTDKKRIKSGDFSSSSAANKVETTAQQIDLASERIAQPFQDLSIIVEKSYFMDDVPLPFTEEGSETRASRGKGTRSESQECGKLFKSKSRTSSLRRSVIFGGDSALGMAGPSRRTRSRSKHQSSVGFEEPVPETTTGTTGTDPGEKKQATVDSTSSETEEAAVSEREKVRKPNKKSTKRSTLQSKKYVSGSESESDVVEGDRKSHRRVTRASVKAPRVSASVDAATPDDVPVITQGPVMHTPVKVVKDTDPTEEQKNSKNDDDQDNVTESPVDSSCQKQEEEEEDCSERRSLEDSPSLGKHSLPRRTATPPVVHTPPSKPKRKEEDPENRENPALKHLSTGEVEGKDRNSMNNTSIDDRAFLPAFISLTDDPSGLKKNGKPKPVPKKPFQRSSTEKENKQKTRNSKDSKDSVTKREEDETTKERRRTFDLPLPVGQNQEPGVSPSSKKSAEGDKTRQRTKRRTFVVLQTEGRQSADEPEHKKDFLEASVLTTAVMGEDIFEETDDVLINSSFDDLAFDDLVMPNPQQPQETTICEAEDMELTEMISVDLSKLKVPPPAFINKDNAAEPAFLAKEDNDQLDKPAQEDLGDAEPASAETGDSSPEGKEKKPNSESEDDKSEKHKLKEDAEAKDSEQENRKDSENITDTEEQDDVSISPAKKPRTGEASSNTKEDNEVEPEAPDEKEAEESEAGSTGATSEDSEVESNKHPVKAKPNQPEKKKFTAMLDRPGKIKFTTGRMTLTDLQGSGTSRSKSKAAHSILPKINKRSKARLKATLPDKTTKPGEVQSVFDFAGTPQGTLKDGSQKSKFEKSVFDLSMNESLCGVRVPLPKPAVNKLKKPTKPKKAEKAAAKSAVKKEEEEKEEDEKMPFAKKTTVVESPHGIMLVLGNGKRTKPRARSKQVSISTKVPDIKLTTPAPKTPVEADAALDAGSTPCKAPTDEPSATVSKDPDNGKLDVQVPDDVLAVPESPFQNKTVKEKQLSPKKRKSKMMAVFNSDSGEEDEDSAASKGSPTAEKKAKLLLTSDNKVKDKQNSVHSQVQAFRLKRLAQEEERKKLFSMYNSEPSSNKTTEQKRDAKKCKSCNATLKSGSCESCLHQSNADVSKQSSVVSNKSKPKGCDSGADSATEGDAHTSRLPKYNRTTRVSLSRDSDEAFMSLKPRKAKPISSIESSDCDSEAESVSSRQSIPKPSAARRSRKPAINYCEDSDVSLTEASTKPQVKRLTKRSSLLQSPQQKQRLKLGIKNREPDSSTKSGKSQKLEVETSGKQKKSLHKPASASPDVSIGSVTEKKTDRKENAAMETSLDSVTPRCSLEPSNESSRISEDGEGRRGGRRRAAVSYKEPSLGAKLRQGDPGTVSLYKDDVKTKKTQKTTKAGKKSSSTTQTKKRNVLHSVANIVSADSSPLPADQ